LKRSWVSSSSKAFYPLSRKIRDEREEGREAETGRKTERGEREEKEVVLPVPLNRTGCFMNKN